LTALEAKHQQEITGIKVFFFSETLILKEIDKIILKEIDKNR
jgi:hypothetical protein